MAYSRRDTPAAARVENVSLQLGGRPIFRNLTLTVPTGVTTVITGPNGAGKTSLIRLLAGVLQPTAGAVTRSPETRVGFVPQRVALYPFLTVRENALAAGYGAGLRGPELDAHVADALAAARCAAVAGRRIGELSGGYQKRASIAAASVARPNFLLLDEPTAGLDIEAAREIAQALRAVKDSGTTVVLTTHDFEFADLLADNVLFLRDGTLVRAGSPRSLVDALFGTAQRIDLVLSGAKSIDPNSTGAASRHRCLFRDLGADGTAPLMRELEAEGCVVEELRLRNPGLATLYERFCVASVSPP